MKELCGETILSKFGKYSYIHKDGSKPVLILFWIRDSIAIFKKETNIFVNSLKITVNSNDRIDVVVGGDHSRGVFCFPMKFIYVMDNQEIIEHEAHVGYKHCRKDNGMIHKNTCITKFGESFNKVLHSFSFKNQHNHIHNIYVIYYLTFSYSNKFDMVRK